VDEQVRGPSRAARRQLKAACLAEAGEGSCLFVRPNRWGHMGPDGQHDLLRPVFAAYSNATFCLQPPGDAISRKGVVDALLLGCIPVFFHPDQARQWPWHFSWASEASVTLPLGDAAKAIRRLASVPIGQVRRMQQAIRRHAGTLAYRLTDLPRGRTDDAFAILLAELQRHSLQRLARPAQPMALPMAQPRPHRHQISPHRYQISPHEEHQQLAVPGAQPRSRIDVSSIDAFTSAGG